MKNKDTAQRFAKDMDNGVHKAGSGEWKGSGEYRELLELGQVLAEHDFSRNTDQQAVWSKVRSRTGKVQAGSRRSPFRSFKRPAMIAASLLVACAVSASVVNPTFAQEILGRVLQTINLGHIIANEMDPDQIPEIPEEMKGKIYDKDGRPVVSFDQEIERGQIFTADGEPIVNFVDGKPVTQKEQDVLDKEKAAGIFSVKTLAELNEYAAFEVKLPEYLPEGIAFDHGELYKGKEGISGKYVDLIFTSEKKGIKFWMQQSYADHETAYEMSTDGKIEQVKVNGIDAVLMNSKSLDWEADGVLYSLSTQGLDREEIMQIAESIR